MWKAESFCGVMGKLGREHWVPNSRILLRPQIKKSRKEEDADIAVCIPSLHWPFLNLLIFLVPYNFTMKSHFPPFK